MSDVLTYAKRRTKTNRRRREPIIDALPEFYHYVDDGCEVSPRPGCLQCPLPQCKYDDPDAYHREQRHRRDLEVLLARHADGASVPQLAQRFGLSERTIHRIFARVAEGGAHNVETDALMPAGTGGRTNGSFPSTPAHQRSQGKTLSSWRES